MSLRAPGGGPRVAVVADPLEEGWLSMDLVAEMLVDRLERLHGDRLRVTLLRPAMRRRFSAADSPPGRRRNADRLLTRHFDYPRWLRRRAAGFDLFHVVDHSYAQLVHALPAGRSVVTCHDLDAFRSWLEPESERRPFWFRAMARRTLRGLERAARVTCDSRAVADGLLAGVTLEPGRVSVVYNGVHPACTPRPDPKAERRARELLAEDGVELLHVGSTVPRKRIDFLLRLFARIRAARPEARLVRVGGDFTAEQRRLAEELGVAEAVRELPYLERPVLAAFYRRASLVLLPSQREGFGLPVVEAMACGTLTVASDLPVLREVGGSSVTYLPPSDLSAWVTTTLELLHQRSAEPRAWNTRREAAIARAAEFSWETYAEKMVELYHEVFAERASESSSP